MNLADAAVISNGSESLVHVGCLNPAHAQFTRFNPDSAKQIQAALYCEFSFYGVGGVFDQNEIL